jgi:hypothetical protein
MLITSNNAVHKQALATAIRCRNGQINHNEGRQVQDAREQMYSKKHLELTAIVDRRYEVVKSQPWYNRVMTLQEARDGGEPILFSFLALAVMVLQPPLRGDWGHMKYIDLETLALADVHPDENYYSHDHDFEDTIVIKKDKVSSRTGSGFIPVAYDVACYIAESMRIYPRTYVFCQFACPDDPMGVNRFTSYLRSIRDPGDPSYMLNQGVQLLRSSYITWAYSMPGVDHNAKVDLAKAMRHSWQMAEVHYNKIK